MKPEWLVGAAVLLAMVADYVIVWRSFVRDAVTDATRARRHWWLRSAVLLWACCALILALWSARGWPAGLFGVPAGWRLWVPVGLTVAVVSIQLMGAIRIMRMTGDKARLRAQLAATAHVMPHSASELAAWFGMSLTAGICEEVIFRGFLVWLLLPFAGWWAAAAVSLAIFAAAHAYQGGTGVFRSALMGAVITLVVFVSQSLWPAILLHAALDAMGGWIGWLILHGDTAEATSPSVMAYDA